ncbi:50S ribosomal protein L24 [Candidatus Zinderia endosymbiont of Aphrophora alni]|uniref:50S ribosomal protein L24 n=1 Tax=Candidatus Zinderia endosymbiont of Aphrophora alni TaxID=3077951 RepID=UPI0030CDFA3D
MKKIKLYDKVKILSGKHKGKFSIIIKILKNNYIIVEKVNIVKKTKKRKINENNITNGFFEKNMPIHISNISVLRLLKKKI